MNNTENTKTHDYDVFLSYDSKDEDCARDLTQRLTNDGVRVWFDKQRITPPEAIPTAINQGIRNSRVLAFLMSEHSLGPEATGWVQYETNAAIFRDPSNRQRRFIPIRIDDVEIPEALRPFAYVDCARPAS